MKKYVKTIIFIINFLCLVILFLSLGINQIFPSLLPHKPPQISYKDFIRQVEDGKIESVAYNKTSSELSGTTVEGQCFRTDNPQTDDFRKYLLEHGVKVIDANPSIFSIIGKSLFQLLMTCLSFYLLAIILSKILLKNQIMIGSGNFGIVERSNVTFEDVAGNEEAKEDMMEIIEFLRNPMKYKRYGATIPKGTILYGQPGTGKTLLAKALAGTAKVPFIAVSGSDFVEKFVGVGAARIRQLFELARKNAPCIVFIDEIDAVGKKRGGTGGGLEERDQTLNQLLVEMDGFTGNEGIVVIAATNRLDTLDEALLRSGRFDRQIYIGLPDIDARYEILKLHSKNKPLNPEVDLREVARMTTFMSGADLANIMNEASIYAARYGHKGILMSDIDRAINKIIAGEEKKNKKNITKKDKEIAAFHEAGHALVAKILTSKSISKVTIIPTTRGAGGYTMITPESERLFESKQDLLNDIAINLGGRAAEEIVFGEENITGGASQDLKAVTQIATKMVMDYGMSKTVGLISIGELYKNSFGNEPNEIVAREIKNIVDEVYEKTKKLLNENKNILFSLAHVLLDKETVYEKEIDAVINGSIAGKSV